MSVKAEFEKLKKLVNDTADDVEKVEKNQKAARTRVRKKMQEIKAQAQQVRVVALAGGSEPAGESGE